MGNCCFDSNESGAEYMFFSYDTNPYFRDDYLKTNYQGADDFLKENGCPIIIEKENFIPRNEEEEIFIKKNKHLISFRYVYPNFSAYATSLTIKRKGSLEHFYIIKKIIYKKI